MARSDVQLMLDVKAGDEVSFELLLRKYRTPLVNYLGRMTGDSAAAEDLAQEVFLRVYRARSQYSPSAKFTTWMFRIATNLALNCASRRPLPAARGPHTGREPRRRWRAALCADSRQAAGR